MSAPTIRESAGIFEGTDSSTAFEAFTDAFGGAVGQLRQSHRYDAPGTYGFSLTVTDKDGGADTEQAQVPVLTVKQALSQIIEQLKMLIASTADPTIRRCSGARAGRSRAPSRTSVRMGPMACWIRLPPGLPSPKSTRHSLH
jgi:PKD repeat protein